MHCMYDCTYMCMYINNQSMYLATYVFLTKIFMRVCKIDEVCLPHLLVACAICMVK